MQPPASLDALADPIYEAFYGLTEQPFATSTDPKFLFLGSSHRQAFKELANGLRRREALILLSGETGTGKTTLCRAAVTTLDGPTFSAIIHNPYMSGPEVLRTVLREFGFLSRDEIRRGVMAQADVPQLIDALEGFLRSLIPLDGYAVVVIDEAQSLSDQVLDEIRMMTAAEQGGRRLLQIVLVGQPTLLETLGSRAMSALNERVTRRIAIEPLAASEVAEYIRHRLDVAGGAAVTFEPDASALVAELSRGFPRRVNVICDRTLQEGRKDGAMALRVDHVKRAARALAGAPGDLAPSADEPSASAESPTVSSHGFRRWIALGSAAALVAAGGLAYGLYARSVLHEDPGIPDHANAAPLWQFQNLAAVPGPAPSDADLQAWLDAAKISASGQLPDNRDQLD